MRPCYNNNHHHHNDNDSDHNHNHNSFIFLRIKRIQYGFVNNDNKLDDDTPSTLLGPQ